MRAFRTFLALIAASGYAAAWGNPTAPTIPQGTAVFSLQGNKLPITTTPGAIINWQGFSIQPSEMTRFIQQSPSGAVLNRVIGSSAAPIHGTLQPNGNVTVMAPNGAPLASGAKVPVQLYQVPGSSVQLVNQNGVFIDTKLFSPPAAAASTVIRAPDGTLQFVK